MTTSNDFFGTAIESPEVPTKPSSNMIREEEDILADIDAALPPSGLLNLSKDNPRIDPEIMDKRARAAILLRELESSRGELTQSALDIDNNIVKNDGGKTKNNFSKGFTPTSDEKTLVAAEPEKKEDTTTFFGTSAEKKPELSFFEQSVTDDLPQPGFLKAFQSGADQTAAHVHRSMSAYVQNLPFLPESLKDKYSDYARSQVESLEKNTIPPEQAAKMDLPNRLYSALGGMSLGLAASILTRDPRPGIFWGMMSAYGEQLKEIEEGLSVGAGAVSTALEIPLQGMANSVPLFGATKIGAGLIAAGSNILEDIISKSIHKIVRQTIDPETNKKFAEKYQPFSVDDMAVNGILGYTMGYGLKFAMQRGEMAAKARHDWLVENIFPEFQRLLDDFNDNIQEYNFVFYDNLNLPRKTKFFHLLADLKNDIIRDDQGNQFPITDKFPVVLDFIKKNYEENSPESQLASYLISTYQFYRKINPTGPAIGLAPLNIVNDLVTSKDARGLYNPALDEISLDTFAGSPKTLLHEMQHALESNILETVLGNPTGNPPKNPATDHLTNIANHIKDIYDTFKLPLLESVLKDPKYKNTSYKTILNDIKNEVTTFSDGIDQIFNAAQIVGIFPDLVQKVYGLTNLHEFLAEAGTNPVFKDVLRSFIPSQADQIKFSPNYFGNSATRFLFESEPFHLKTTTGNSLFSILGYNRASLLGLVAGKGMRLWPKDTSTMHSFLVGKYGGDKSLNDFASSLISSLAEEHKISSQASHYLMARIGAIMESNPRTRQEAFDQLVVLFPNQEWKDLVQANQDIIFANKAKFIEVFSQNSLNKVAKGTDLSQYLGSIKQALKELFPKNFSKESDDMSKSGTYFYGKDILSILKQKTLGDKLARIFNDKINEWVIFKAQLTHDFMRYQTKFASLHDVGKLETMAIAGYWESLRMSEFLKTNGYMYPDKALIQQHQPNVSEAAIDAYLQMASGYMRIFNSLDAAMISMQLKDSQGNPLKLKRIPGFMPHFFDGNIKVMIKVNDAQGNSKVFLRGFSTIFQAERYIKGVQSAQNPDITILPRDNGKLWDSVDNRSPAGAGLISALVDHYAAYDAYAQVAPDVAQILASLDTNDTRGWSKHVMDRSDVHGYIGEEGLGKAPTSYMNLFRNKSARDVLSIYERYANSVSDFVGNTYFTKNVLEPLLSPSTPDNPFGGQPILAKMPNLTEYILAQAKNFTGENVNILRDLDAGLSTLATKLKLHPHFFKFIVRDLKNLLSTIRLRTPRNWFANYQQPILGVSTLYMFAIDNGLITGETKSNPFASYMWAKDQLTGNLSDEASFALNWAKAKHITDEMQDKEMGIQGGDKFTRILDAAVLGGINQAIEGHSRETSFLMAYHFVKPWYKSRIEALEAAERATRLIMVNYDRASRPHIFQNTGVFGEAFSTFAIFRNQYIGNTYMAWKYLKENRTNIDAYKPLLIGQAIYIGLAGMIGAIGAVEYDWFAKLVNEILDPEYRLPSIGELSRMLNMPDFMLFGATAEATKLLPGTPEGFYIGGSATAPGVTNLWNPPLWSFVVGLATIGMIGFKEALALVSDYPGMSSDELYSSLRKVLPPQMEEAFHWYFKVPTDLGVRATSLEGHVDRSPSDRLSQLLYASSGIEEWKKRRTLEIMNRGESTMKSKVDAFAEKVADNALGIPLGISLEEAYTKALSWDPTLTVSDFEQRVNQKITKRLTSKRTRELEQGSAKSIYQNLDKWEKYGTP